MGLNLLAVEILLLDFIYFLAYLLLSRYLKSMAYTLYIFWGVWICLYFWNVKNVYSAGLPNYFGGLHLRAWDKNDAARNWDNYTESRLCLI